MEKNIIFFCVGDYQVSGEQYHVFFVWKNIKFSGKNIKFSGKSIIAFLWKDIMFMENNIMKEGFCGSQDHSFHSTINLRRGDNFIHAMESEVGVVEEDWPGGCDAAANGLQLEELC